MIPVAGTKAVVVKMGAKWTDSGSVLETALTGLSMACMELTNRENVSDPRDRVAVGTIPEMEKAWR